MGVVIVILGTWLIFSSGADLSNLPLLDISAKIGEAEITATDIPPEAETKLLAGFILLFGGFIPIKLGM